MEARERLAEAMWRAEYKRGAGRERSVPWSEAGDTARKAWLPIADAVIAALHLTDAAALGLMDGELPVALPVDKPDAEAIDPVAVNDASEDDKGLWRSCSGCHELDEGYPTGRYSKALSCHVGLGCRECGGIGAVWDMLDYAEMADYLSTPPPSIPPKTEADYFGGLVLRARAAAAKASAKFPQPNYVTLKIAEEAGEVVRGAVHYAEGRMPWDEVEGEIVQLLAMLIRFVTEGDQINGVTPPASLASPEGE